MNSKTICYDDIFEFCEDVDSSFLRKYYAAIKDNSTVDIAIAAKYDSMLWAKSQQCNGDLV